MILNMFILGMSLPFFLVRWLRWVAIVQQKEYRLDRLSSFFFSQEGKNNFWRAIPHPSDFSRTGLKRPVRTVRALVVMAVSMLLLGFVIILTVNFKPLFFALVLLLLYFLLPVINILACVPSALAVASVTLYTLWRAQKKIQQGHPRIIGVGGSYGKTSTKHLLHHVLSQKYSVFVTPKSHNTKYSVAKSICQSYSNQEIALLEYGAYTKGEIAYLTKWFPPDLAIETGFTLQHLEIFGSQENSLLAESELVHALPSTGKVFCNEEDGGAEKICQLGSAKNRVQVVPYSGKESVVELQRSELNDQGELTFYWKNHCIRTRLIGKHYLVNVQGVIAVAEEFGLTEKEIITGLTSFVPNSSFIQLRKLQNDVLVIDDGGTSNPKGFEAAIQIVSEMQKESCVLITAGIVDLGTANHEVHAQLAKQAKQVFSQVFYLGVDGRDEFKVAFDKSFTTDKAEMVQKIQKLRPGSVILIEGKIPQWIDQLLNN